MSYSVKSNDFNEMKKCERKKYQANIPLPTFSTFLWSVVYRLRGMVAGCGALNAD